jgi:hypothetical protein
MPRPPLGEKAMTDAERQRRRRERLRKEQGPKLSDRQKLIEAQKEIDRLRRRVRNLEAERELRKIDTILKDAAKGGISFATRSTIMKALHPDRQPSEAERAEACRAFTAWVDDRKPARR